MQISLKDLNQIITLLVEIHEELDEDFPDGRVIGPKMGAINRRLAKVTDDREMQIKIYLAIKQAMWRDKPWAATTALLDMGVEVTLEERL